MKRPPVWIMRQAGRYLPEYRRIREKYSFMEMVKTPSLAAEVTLLPIQRYGMDAAILFADILLIAETMGQSVSFKEGVGPILEPQIDIRGGLDHKVCKPIKEKLSYVEKTIGLLKKELTVPLLGFAGAPFTVASYMIEGGASKDLKKTKKFMLQDPASFHRLLDQITTSTIEYLKMQEKAGVNAVQLFETWSNVLAYRQFQEFSISYMKKILDTLTVPAILFGRGTSGFIHDLVSLQPAGISLDWSCDLPQMRKVVPSHIALQGNLDPHILYADHKTIQKECLSLLHKMKGDQGYIFNLGHGILPDVDPDAVQVLVETVKGEI